MSNPALATRLVVPFEELRMTDVDIVGGKNATLGEMISQLAATGVRVPGGFATTAHAFREFLEVRRPDRAHRQAPEVARHRRRARAGRGRHRDPPLDRGRAVPARARSRRARRVRAPVRQRPERLVRRALVGHRRRPARRVLRRPAGDLPQRRRHRRRAGQDEATSSPRSTTTARSPTACTRASPHAEVALSAGVQRMVRSDLGAAGVMFTLDTESRLQRRRLHHLQLRPGRDGGAGRGQPRRVLRPQADAGGRQVPGHPPQPRLQADQDGVRHARGEGQGRQAR